MDNTIQYKTAIMRRMIIASTRFLSILTFWFCFVVLVLLVLIVTHDPHSHPFLGSLPSPTVLIWKCGLLVLVGVVVPRSAFVFRAWSCFSVRAVCGIRHFKSRGAFPSNA